MEAARAQELHKMLMERRREVGGKVKQGLQECRQESVCRRMQDVSEPAQDADADVQEDIELAIIQIQAETVSKIDEALARLTQGTYGYCSDCGKEIAENRLQALPFAVRCKDCEEAREIAERHERSRSRSGWPLLVDMD